MAFIDELLRGGNPSTSSFLSPLNQPGALGIMPGEEAGIPTGLPPGAPGPLPGGGGVASKIDDFLSRPSGIFLLNLLAQGGTSFTPGPGAGAVIGRAGLRTQETLRERADQDKQNELIEATIGLRESQAEQLAIGGAGRGNVAKSFKGANGNMHIITRGGDVRDTGIPFNENVKFFTQADGSVIGVDASTGQRLGEVITPKEAAESTVTAAQNVEAGEQTVKLPVATAKAQTSLDLLDQISVHPGFEGAVGLKSIAQGFGVVDEPIAGTDEADFVALVNQISGTVFLEAFQDLKGGGHITEIEGEKAEQAIARIKNRNQSEGGYRAAIADLRKIIKDGIKRKQQAAAGDFSAEPKKRRVFNRQTGKIEEK